MLDTQIGWKISLLGAAIQNDFYNFVDLEAHQKVFLFFKI